MNATTEKSSTEEPKFRIGITIQNLSASVGAIAGVIALFLVIAPRTALSLGAWKTPGIVVLAIAVAASTIALLHRILASQDSMLRKRLEPTRTSIIVWIIVVGTAVLYLLAIWTPPTPQQIARQILNNRGMFLTRAHYMTSIEIGDWGSVDLFHEAGFDHSTAFHWLGHPAQTHPEMLSLDMLMSHDDVDRLTNTIAAIAGHDNNDTDSTRRPTTLIDDPILATYSFNEDGRQSWSESASEELIHMVSAKGLPLLGYAILGSNRSAVDALLGLGADWTAATIPLLELGELIKYSPLLMIDPFLFLLNSHRQGEDAGLYLLDQTDVKHPLVDTLRDQGYYPTQFAFSYTYADHPKDCVDDRMRRFVGFRRLESGDYELGDFVSSWCVTANQIVQADGEMNFIPAGNEDPDARGSRVRGVLRIAISRDDEEMLPQRFAWLSGSTEESPSIEGPWLHYAGSYLPDSRLLLLRDGTDQIRLTSTSGSVTANSIDRALRLAKENELGSLSCRSGKSLRLIHEEHMRLTCDAIGEVTIARRDGHGAYLVALEQARGAGSQAVSYLLLVDDPGSIRLESGSHAISAVDLSAGGAITVEIGYRVAEPRLTVFEDSESVTDWPTDDVDWVADLRENDQRVMLFGVSRPINVRLMLTGMSADVDLSLDCLEGGELCPWLGYTSIRSGRSDEEIEATLGPGTYRIRVYSLDSPSSFRLSVSGDRTTELVLADGSGRHVEEEPSNDDLVSFEIDSRARVEVSLDPTDRDMDLQLIDESGALLGESQAPGTERDEVFAVLDEGLYYARIEAAGISGKYEVVVAATYESQE